jgi:hypothetical protein
LNTMHHIGPRRRRDVSSQVQLEMDALALAMRDMRRSAPNLSWLAWMIASQAFACTGTIDTELNTDGAAGTDPMEAAPTAPDAPALPMVDAEGPPATGGAGTAAGTAGASDTGGAATANPPSGNSGVGGGAGSAPVGATEPVCDAVTDVLIPSCGGGSCHSNRDARIGDWGVGREEAESFVDVPSVRNVACGFIIDSQDPSQSLLLRKLIGDFPIPMCGGPMPSSGPDLTDEQISCMASWLQQFQR